MEWISVKDELPKKERIDYKVAIYTVIAQYNGMRTFCRFYKNHHKTNKPEFVCIRNGKITEVTYWQPIPELPE